jgi:hypothetical protein
VLLMLVHIFNFKDMPSNVKTAYNVEAPWYGHTEKEYLEWDLTRPYSQIDDTIKQVLIKL